jgi:hypothetical protein
MAVLGEKLGGGPVDHSAGLGVVPGALFLGSSRVHPTVWWLEKGCHVWGAPTGSIRWAYVNWCGKRTCHVGQVFPCRVYIDSNCRDSWI